MISNEFLDAYSANSKPLSEDMLTYLKYLALNQYLDSIDFIVDTTDDQYDDAAVLFDFLLGYRTVDVEKPSCNFEEKWEEVSGNYFTPLEPFKDISYNSVIQYIVMEYENRVVQTQTILAIQALSPISDKLS